MVRNIFLRIVFLSVLSIGLSCTNKDTSTVKNQQRSRALYLDSLAMHYQSRQAYDSAYYYQNAAKISYLADNDNSNAAKAIVSMAKLQIATGDNSGAEYTVNQALSLNNPAPPVSFLSDAYITLATIHKNLQDHTEAIQCYRKAYRITYDSLQKINIKQNIARIHVDKGNYKRAIAILAALNKSAIAAKDPVIKATITDRLGYALFKKTKKEGLQFMLKGLMIREESKDSAGILLSFLHLSEYYASEPGTAKEYAKKAYLQANKLHDPDRILEALSFLMTYSTGNELKKYSGEYLTFESRLKKMRLGTKHRFEKMELNSFNDKANQNSKTDKELLLKISSDSNKFLLLSLIFTILASVLLYFLIQSKHKRDRFLEAYTTETRIAKKVHDEIANEIYGTINYLSAEESMSGKKKEKLLSLLDNIYLMTKNISRETNNIDLGKNFPEQLKLMLNAYRSKKVNIVIKGINDINWEHIEITRKIATYRSLQELMVNMKKHSNASVAIIDFCLDGKKIKIYYSDNGRGASSEKLLLKNGLQNVENRINSIDGNVIFDTNAGNGFHLTLTYPAYTPYVQKNFNNRRY
jgi:signal transduction histidine kinase